MKKFLALVFLVSAFAMPVHADDVITSIAVNSTLLSVATDRSYAAAPAVVPADTNSSAPVSVETTSTETILANIGFLVLMVLLLVWLY